MRNAVQRSIVHFGRAETNSLVHRMGSRNLRGFQFVHSGEKRKTKHKKFRPSLNSIEFADFYFFIPISDYIYDRLAKRKQVSSSRYFLHKLLLPCVVHRLVGSIHTWQQRRYRLPKRRYSENERT